MAGAAGLAGSPAAAALSVDSGASSSLPPQPRKEIEIAQDKATPRAMMENRFIGKIVGGNFGTVSNGTVMERQF